MATTDTDLDDVTVSVNGGPEHPAGSPEADQELAAAAARAMGHTGELPGMPVRPVLRRANRDIDHVKVAIKGGEQLNAYLARVVDLANRLRIDTPLHLACSGVIVGENITQKLKDGALEHTLTITIELEPDIDDLERAAAS